MAFGSDYHSVPCGLYYNAADEQPAFGSAPATQTYTRYIPVHQLSLDVKASILSSVARTAFTQTFRNTTPHSIPEARFSFPLYDGVSVASFTCTVDGDRVIKGVVQENKAARATYEEATARGRTAGLLEQLPSASDVFTTTIGNIPAGGMVKVDIVVLGELKQDAETDGIRFTVPSRIARRYGYQRYQQHSMSSDEPRSPITIVVDVELPVGSTISSLQSPSHPISVGIGALSTSDSSASSSPRLASASLGRGPALVSDLREDFVLQVCATNIDRPVAILEHHSIIPNQRALMTTLVPRFNLPQQRPEIVFVCDRSGSMRGRKIVNLASALRLFLKSLPLGVTFNICGFGAGFQFLFPKSRAYDSESVEAAMRYADTIDANFGGTEIREPLIETFRRKLSSTELEVLLLTDGSVWNQRELMDVVSRHVEESEASIRLFTLAIGSDASHSMVEGLARAGKGFSQTVGDYEIMDKKVVRMLKGALTPHIHDYTLEVKYKKPDGAVSDDDDFELIDSVAGLTLDVVPTVGQSTEDVKSAPDASNEKTSTAPISLYDPNFDPNAQIESSGVTAPSLANIPRVAIPNILQAPFKVPPLYPFNRTSVYLIMSPDTGDKTPESVIFRATSQHGPLELEIPVTTTTTGESIHQLAARKAMHELEEGRGWIFHAKEKACNMRLEHAYKDQFGQMVQAEATRLGETFNVAGRWCSFVAADEKDGDGESTEMIMIPNTTTTTTTTPKKKTKAPPSIFMRYNASPLPDSMQASQAGPLEALRAQASPSGMPSGGVLFGSAQRDAPAPPLLTPRHPLPGSGSGSTNAHGGGGLFGNAPPQISTPTTNAYGGGGLFGNAPPQISTPTTNAYGGGGLFGNAPPQISTPTTNTHGNGGLFGNAPLQISTPTINAHGGGGLFGNAPPQISTPTTNAHGGRILFGHQARASTTLFGGVTLFDGGSARPVEPRQPEKTPLQKIYGLQGFDGCWNEGDKKEIAGVIGATEEQLTKLLLTVQNDAEALNLGTTSPDVLALTMAVVVFLETKLAADRGVWELMVEKALSWLAQIYGTREKAREAITTVERVLG